MTSRQLLFPIALIFSQACQQEPKGPTEDAFRQLQEDHERLQAKLAEKDSTVDAFFGTFNQISENLRTVRQKQGLLGTAPNGSEQGGDDGEAIMEEIRSIDALLDQNKELIARLRREAAADNKEMKSLLATIAELERLSAEKDEEIAVLKEQLASSNSSLATLIEMYRDKVQLTAAQQTSMNTAYYCVGTAKELRANGVLTREGGVAGLGGVDKLQTSDLAKGYFKRIDTSVDSEIPIAADKAKLATSHPEGSYTIENGRLIITDPDAFWSLSRYLVVVVS